MLAGVSAVYWVLGTAGSASERPPMVSVSPYPNEPATIELAHALGGKPLASASAPATESTPYQLLGVVAGPVGKGYALLVVGSAAPKAYMVGTVLREGLILQSVSARSAKIGATLQGPTTLELVLPKPPAG